MLDGNLQEQEKRELSAREKLGLAGNYRAFEGASSTRAEKKYEPENLVLPEDQTKSKLPQGMTVREYLLSPPKVDMEKFMQSKPKGAAARQNTFEQSYNNISTSEINSNIDKLNHHRRFSLALICKKKIMILLKRSHLEAI